MSAITQYPFTVVNPLPIYVLLFITSKTLHLYSLLPRGTEATRSCWSGWRRAFASTRACSSAATTRPAWPSGTACSSASISRKKLPLICNYRSSRGADRTSAEKIGENVYCAVYMVIFCFKLMSQKMIFRCADANSTYIFKPVFRTRRFFLDLAQRLSKRNSSRFRSIKVSWLECPKVDY